MVLVSQPSRELICRMEARSTLFNTAWSKWGWCFVLQVQKGCCRKQDSSTLRSTEVQITLWGSGSNKENAATNRKYLHHILLENLKFLFTSFIHIQTTSTSKGRIIQIQSIYIYILYINYKTRNNKNKTTTSRTKWTLTKIKKAAKYKKKKSEFLWDPMAPENPLLLSFVCLTACFCADPAELSCQDKNTLNNKK